MRHIVLTLQYDGTDYSGWQVQNPRIQNSEYTRLWRPAGVGSQKKIITIQGTVQEAIKRVTGEDARLIAASRTDAGVHAIGQVASFKSNTLLDTETLKQALNANLPPDIRVTHVMEADEGFHPRYSAKGKVYSYLISSSQPHSVFLRRYTWQIYYDLSSMIYVMQEAAKYIIGEHDFSCFRASGCGSKTSVRVISDISISECSDLDFLTFRLDVKLFKITIEANAFLRHMARNIVGTLVDIGKGRFEPSYVREMFRLKKRDFAGVTAPARGLFLEKIIY